MTLSLPCRRGLQDDKLWFSGIHLSWQGDYWYHCFVLGVKIHNRLQSYCVVIRRYTLNPISCRALNQVIPGSLFPPEKSGLSLKSWLSTSNVAESRWNIVPKVRTKSLSGMDRQKTLEIQSEYEILDDAPYTALTTLKVMLRRQSWKLTNSHWFFFILLQVLKK